MSPLSKPLLAGLLATMVASLLVLLQPEASVLVSARASLLPDRRGVVPPAQGGPRPWVRESRPLPVAYLDRGFAPPRPALVNPVIVVTPPPPPKPIAPQPAFIYLGRMVRDDQTYVFLGYGEEVEVVAIGATIGGSWRVDGVTEAGVELNYLPLNESRRLAMSER